MRSLSIYFVLSFITVGCLAGTVSWVGPAGSAIKASWFNASNWNTGKVPTINDDVILSTSTSSLYNIWVQYGDTTPGHAYAKSITCQLGNMVVVAKGAAGAWSNITLGSGGLQWLANCTGYFQVGGAVTCKDCSVAWNFLGAAENYPFVWQYGSIDISVPININSTAYVSSLLNTNGTAIPSTKYLNTQINVIHPFALLRFENVGSPNANVDGSGFFFGPKGGVNTIGHTWFGGICPILPAKNVNFTSPVITGSGIIGFYPAQTGGLALTIVVPMNVETFGDLYDTESSENYNINISAPITAGYFTTVATVLVVKNQWSKGVLTLSSPNQVSYFGFDSLNLIGTRLNVMDNANLSALITCDGCVVDTSSGCHAIYWWTLSAGSTSNTATWNVGCPMRVLDDSVMNAQSINMYPGGVLEVDQFNTNNLWMNGGAVSIAPSSSMVSTANFCDFDDGTISSNSNSLAYMTSSYMFADGPSNARIIDAVVWTVTGGFNKSYYSLRNGAVLQTSNKASPTPTSGRGLPTPTSTKLPTPTPTATPPTARPPRGSPTPTGSPKPVSQKAQRSIESEPVSQKTQRSVGSRSPLSDLPNMKALRSRTITATGDFLPVLRV